MDKFIKGQTVRLVHKPQRDSQFKPEQGRRDDPAKMLMFYYEGDIATVDDAFAGLGLYFHRDAAGIGMPLFTNERLAEFFELVEKSDRKKQK